MKVSDLLVDDWVAVPMEARTLQEAVRTLVGLLETSGTVDAEGCEGLIAGFAEHGDVVRINGEIVLLVGHCETIEDVSVLLGIGRQPFTVEKADAPTATARAVILLITPRRAELLRDRVAPVLSRVLKDEESTARLLAAGSALHVRALKELMEVELHDRFLVEDALTPLRYRIYPDTPLPEVVDLMVRRGLPTVPVVGESYEVLGLITVGDVLQHLLPGSRAGEKRGRRPAPPPALTARDVMTRTVMCVSEDESLLDAANLMLKRDVDQLPVVREGELIGFLTRDAILRTFFRPEKRPGEAEQTG